MPNGFSHHALTRLALENVPGLFPAELCSKITEVFSLYPDCALAGKDDAEQFLPARDGIPFHYLRDTSFELTYRHYARNKAGKLVRCGNFENPHYDFSVPALSDLLSSSLGYFRNKDPESSAKTTGILLHLLQDHTFGVHTLEGLGGTDVYYFNRLKVWKESPVRTLCALRPPEDLSALPRKGVMLGNTVEETALRLYHRMCHANRTARTLCMKTLLGEADTAREMAVASALVCADALASLDALKNGCAEEGRTISLTEFEPYEISHQVWGDDLPDRFEFSVPAEEHLLFRFSKGVFTELSAEITAEKALVCELVNEERSIEKILFADQETKSVSINIPSGLCGLRFYAQKECGMVKVFFPQLVRAAGRIS